MCVSEVGSGGVREVAMGGGGTGDDEGRLHGRVWECGERRWRAVGGVCVVEWGEG